MAQHGHQWWEIDTTYWVIALMEKTGLAWNVVHKTAATTVSTEIEIQGAEEPLLKKVA